VYGATIAEVAEHLPKVPRRTLMRWLADAREAGAIIATGKTTATRYTLPEVPAAADRRRAAPTLDAPVCPACGSLEYRDTVSADRQMGQRHCAKCKKFIAFTIWHGKPMAPRPTGTPVTSGDAGHTVTASPRDDLALASAWVQDAPARLR
jgi:hypothetical protein